VLETDEEKGAFHFNIQNRIITRKNPILDIEIEKMNNFSHLRMSISGYLVLGG